ncbi:SpoIIE family protein phosphatase [Amycolatopsis acidiphila]|uniref:protein-serine/threonine phosphatase n=2 Tax=Amycolatopsis acidiphila TaxID=715473 RepID=A0A558ACZ4_9PSEU|nr:SpoIIE family protein phosphatase [Amycolatopsis acidiphila]
MRLAATVRRATRDTPDPAGAIAQEIHGWFTRELAGVRVFVAGELAGLAGEPDAAAEAHSFGGALDGDKTYRVALHASAEVPADAAGDFAVVAAAVRAALTGEDGVAAVEDAAAARAEELERVVERLRAEAVVVDTLHAVGRRLTAQLELDVLVQEATDAATRVTGAAFGAFFYNLINEYGESYTLYTLSGVPRSAFSSFPMPRNTQVFAPTFDGVGTVRSGDITRDPRYGHNAPHYGMPEGHLPVRSYLAVPVIAPSTGEVLGGFFFGHDEPGRFDERGEYLAEGIAGYTAIALDNARFFARERTMASELARSMVPKAPAIDGMRIVSRYQPASTGSKVGGDWFDVIELGQGRTAFVIGDVVGHGVTAAAIMGQVRTAIRSCALLELSPSEVLHTVSQLVGATPEASFVTCLYAVHDRADDTLTYANAGHLPAVLLAGDGTTEEIGEALAMPLGVGTEFPQEKCGFAPGMRLVLYTDGLIESHTRDLTEGMTILLDKLNALAASADVEATCDELIRSLTGSRHDDDVALLYVHYE